MAINLFEHNKKRMKQQFVCSPNVAKAAVIHPTGTGKSFIGFKLCEDEIPEIQPDFIILDEFHRCGAKLWGQGVQKLLQTYPDVPILGLSATAIRYLDNQRDMTDELFDGNIASEMTLGEAIVRGILSPPKYILSIFSYVLGIRLKSSMCCLTSI